MVFAAPPQGILLNKKLPQSWYKGIGLTCTIKEAFNSPIPRGLWGTGSKNGYNEQLSQPGYKAIGLTYTIEEA